MTRLTSFAVALLFACCLSANAAAAPGVGDQAPAFTLPGSDGHNHTLEDLRGTYVVIAFFPKAFTSG